MATLAAVGGLFGACDLQTSGLQPIALDASVESGPLDGAVEADVVTPENDSAVEGGSEGGIDGGPLSPPEVPGLLFWVRADQQVDLVADAGLDGSAVKGWRDLYDGGPHDLISAPANPQLVPAPTGYGGKPGISFGALDQSRLFNTSLTVAQPMTILIVGHASTDTSYFLDSTSGSRVSILTTTGRRVALYSTAVVPNLGGPFVDTPSVIVAIFAGASSSVFVSSNTGLVNLDPGGASLGGISLGSYQGGGAFGLGGVIAEAAIWQGALPLASIRRVNAYAGQRYGITIKP